MTDAETGDNQAQKRLGSGARPGFDPNMGKDTQFKPGQSGNPAGRPKGRKSLSTEIQRMMDDPKFIERLSQGIKEKTGIDPAIDPEFQGTPMKAIITVALIESMNPKSNPEVRAKSRDWLSRFGYGTKVEVEHSGEVGGLFGSDALTIRVIDGTRDNTEPEATDGV